MKSPPPQSLGFHQRTRNPSEREVIRILSFKSWTNTLKHLLHFTLVGMKFPVAIAQEYYFYCNPEASRIFTSSDPM
jgi:hypothetical protein